MTNENTNVTNEQNNANKKRRKNVLWASLAVFVVLILLLIFFFQKPVTVSFVTNGGSTIDLMSVNEDGYIDTSKVKTSRYGWDFEGWYANELLTIKIEDLATYKFEKASTIYAKWRLHRYTITYELDRGVNNPNNPTEYVIKHAKAEDETWEKDFDKTTNLPIPNSDSMMGKVTIYEPTREGYEFDGWYDNPEMTGEKITTLNTSEPTDIVLYAKWK